MLKHNQKHFWRRFTVVDETWIDHGTPETEEQTKQWVFRDEPAPKKAKADKFMATVFCDMLCITQFDYLEKGKTFNGAFGEEKFLFQKDNINLRRRHGEIL